MNEIEDNPVEELLNGIVKESTSLNDKFEIPMDAPIEEFGYHLKSHPRTILSARFGDGKSFFLSKFEEKKKDDYEIITLYPVNYQVVENKDIFELIKRDILFQITVKGMLDENLDISEEAAWIFFIQNNFMGLTESAMSFLSLLQSPPEMVSGVLTALKSHKILKDLRKKVLEIKKEYKSTDALEAFIDKCDTIPVLEEDLVTKIIQDSIDDYKKKNSKKRIILVIEDMDRLDPAHLFRILNVFSAHLDTNEKYFVKTNGSYFYNKFHFDNVVFVMDFDNTRNIFKHFYGAETNFDGYIEKFITKGIFEYSLKVEKYNYLINRVTSIVGLPEDYVRSVLQQKYFEGKTLRTIVNSFENTDSQIVKYPKYNEKILHIGLLRLYAIMKNLGINGEELVTNYRNGLARNQIDVLPFFINVLYQTDTININKIKTIIVEINNSFLVIVPIDYDYTTNCLKYNVFETTNWDEVIGWYENNFAFGSNIRRLLSMLRRKKFGIDNISSLLDSFVA